ncbi:MAG: ABC transporter permease subunit [Spirochaetia bacterium]|jgi:NitT/TauT family transport system permease protein
MTDRRKNILWPAGFGVALLLLWQAGVFHAILGLKLFQLPVPTEIVQTLAKNLPNALRDCGVTVSGALIGMTIGSLMGFFVAVIATVFPRWGYGGLFVISALNAIPIVALSPIMNQWFSSGMGQKIGVVTVVTMAAMAFNAYRGLNDLTPFSLDLMRSYASGRRTVFFRLRLPNCLPSVFTALKINITSAMIAAIVSEYFASSTAGLGFGIKDNLRKAEMAMGWSYIAIASAAGILFYLLMVFAERRLIRWHASQR